MNNKMRFARQENTIFFFIFIITISRLQRYTLAGMNTSQLTDEVKRIFKNYDKRILPSPMGEPINVTMQIYITDMVALKRYYMHYDVNMFVRQMWTDDRIILPLEESKWQAFGVEAFQDIWIPEIYFPAAKRGIWYDTMKPNMALHVHPNGRLFLSRGISQTIYCPMNLRNFPFDNQECRMDIRLYAYSNKHCRLSWNLERGGPISSPKKIEISEFALKSLSYSTSVANFSEGSYDTLSLTFVLERKLSFYMLNYVLPCAMIVVLSWVGFWIDYRSTPARASLGITTVLTITTLTNSIRASLPQVVYTKSIDVYLLTCFVFVFASMVEFAIVGMTDVKWQKSYRKRKRKLKIKQKELELKVIQEETKIQNSKAAASNKETNLNGNNDEHADEIKAEDFLNQSCISLHHQSSYIEDPSEITKQNTSNHINEDLAGTSKKNETKTDEKTACCLSTKWRKFVDSLAEKHTKTRNDGHVIDKKSRFVFPFLFLTFNLLYFAVVYIWHGNARHD